VVAVVVGYEDDVDYKTYLGDLYSDEINQNHYVLPPESYLKKDHRSVIKDRGSYSSEVDADGGHGDTLSRDNGAYRKRMLTWLDGVM
jgi:hypothetical protein